MKTLELKLTRIGNSQGVRLPAGIIKRYRFSGTLAVEAREEGLLLKPKKQTKLSWADTAKAMAAAGEDWSEWDSTIADGLENCPWEEPLPAEALAWARESSKRQPPGIRRPRRSKA